jgi:hypothetical protein
MIRKIIAFTASALLVSGCGTSTRNMKATGTSTSTVSEIAEMLPCPAYKPTANVGAIEDRELDELSGLAKSTLNDDTMWTHNDSGDSARVFTIQKNGKVTATYNLRNTSTFDAEDIALSSTNPPEVWLADSGDNFHFRPNVQLYHFVEPVVTEGAFIDVDVKKLNVKFQKPNENGITSIDAEAFFIDHSGNGYFVEKTKDSKSAWVFQVSAGDMNKTSVVTAQPVTQITGNTNGLGVGPTAADISPDGTTLAIKNYTETFIWRFTATSSIPAVLKAQPTAPCTVKAGLGEAITFDGQDLLTVEEGVGKPIRRTQAK